MIGAIISKRLATLHEIDTVYGTQDIFDLMEIIAVDNYNDHILNDPEK